MKLLHKLRAGFKYLIVTSPLAQRLRSSALLTTSGSLAGLYFIIFENFKDENIFSLHPVFFSKLTLVVIFCIAILLILKGIGDFIEDRESAVFTKFLEGLSQLTTSVVSAKLDRFKETGKNLTSRSSVFDKVTQPQLQINLILESWIELMRSTYGLKEDELTITIMHENPQDGRRSYFLFETHKSWLHTKSEKIIGEHSLAKYARSTGEPVFIADKKSAAEAGRYYLSDRDEDKGAGVGSAFCYPVKIVNNNYTDCYMISLVTYSKRLCSQYDDERTKSIKYIFCDICRRIELELTLLSIKRWLSVASSLRQKKTVGKKA